MKLCLRCKKEFTADNIHARGLTEQKYCSKICQKKAKKIRWQRRYRDKNKEIVRNKHTVSQRGYREKRGKQYIQFCNNKRKILTSDLTLRVIQQVYEDNIKQYGTLTCYLCLKPIPFGKDHLEHKTPLSRGGNNEYANLAIACQRCNCHKNTKTEAEYRKEILIS